MSRVLIQRSAQDFFKKVHSKSHYTPTIPPKSPNFKSCFQKAYGAILYTMTKKSTKKYTVYTEKGADIKPWPHELAAAELLAEYFKSDIVLIRRAACRTPDLFILKTSIRWELKSPTGNGKRTIQNNLRETSGQSENVILDLSRAKLSDRQGISRTKNFFKTGRSQIKRLKIITKQLEIIDIKP